MWVIFEGLDKAGKGTLEWEFLKATNFKHIIVDRGPAGYAAFDCLFNRVTEEGRMQYGRNLALMHSHPNDFLIIYCKAPTDIALQRIKEHNETCPYDYEFAQRVYDESINILYREMNIITIDTTKPINECIQTIIKKLEEVQKGEL